MCSGEMLLHVRDVFDGAASIQKGRDWTRETSLPVLELDSSMRMSLTYFVDSQSPINPLGHPHPSFGHGACISHIGKKFP